MSVTRQQQLEEAVARLEILTNMGLHPDVLDQFRESGRVFYSDRNPMFGVPVGVLFWVDNDTATSDTGTSFTEVIAAFEERFNAVVYHATHERFTFGEVLDLYYVSEYEEEWPRDRADLAAGHAFVYAANLTDDFMSDLGTIAFRIAGGGLLRTA